MRGGVKTTFHSALKNADVQTSSSGAVASSRVYDAFGNDLLVTGSWKSPFGYAGQFGYQQDVDTGFKLLGHRYYDSDTGRFLTRDPIKDGRNWYGYCENDPVRQFDSDGYLPIIVVAIVVAAVIYVVVKKGVEKYEKLYRSGKETKTELATKAMLAAALENDPPQPPGATMSRAEYYHGVYRDRAENHGMPVDVAAEVFLRGWEINSDLKG